MNRKEKILAYIKSPEYVPLKAEELISVLCVPKVDEDEFLKLLEELLEERKIEKTKKSRYVATISKNIVTGRLSCSNYGFFAFLIPDSEEKADVYINGEHLNGSLHNDLVSVVIDGEDKASGRLSGRVFKILERANTTICGVIKKKKGGFFELRPDSQKIYTKVLVLEENTLGAQPGDRVLVQITSYSPEVSGIVTKILGDSKDLKSNIEAILFEENICTEESSEALLEAENTPQKVLAEDILARRDLRDELIFTIDGDDARDFDDAVSLDLLPNGNYRLGVHIADVTHYVTEGSSLDNDAFLRGTSVYLPDRVIPMLPKKLSNGICSLNPHEDRLTLTVFMDITPAGVVSSHELVKSVIHSRERMTYNNVAELLGENPPKALLSKYSYLLPVLKDMEKLSLLLHAKRMDRGSVDFDFPEAQIIVNDNGEPVDIFPAERKISHKIIEEFMLAANETIAEYAFWAEIPFVFRVHEPPQAESMRDFQRFISSFGLGLKEKFSESEPLHPKALQQVLSSAKGTEEEHMISTYALRSLMKAEYKPENLGHFGLAAKYYCHFTSPIRRYPDLAIHRILKDFIDGKPTEKYALFAKESSIHSSETERKAQLAEREANDLLKVFYMSQYIGYIFDAKISSVTDFGIFAELPNTVEGLIRLENLKDDFYVFNPDTRTLLGKYDGKVYKIGDTIEIAVARCDLLTRRIDFIMAENATMSDIDALQQHAYKRQREKQKKIDSLKKSTKKTFKKRKGR